MEQLNQIKYDKAEDLKRLNFIESSLNSFNGKKLNVLDVGCGNGNISRFIGSKGHNVLGIDISDATISKAISLTNMPNVKFRNVAVESIVAEETFDVIICSEVIEHLDTPSTVVNALKKLLSKNGVLIVTVPNGFGPRELFITKPLQFLKTKTPKIYGFVNSIKHSMGFTGATVQSDAENLTHIQFFTKKSLCNLIDSKDMNLIKFRSSNFIEGVFPFSLITKKSVKLQEIDCWMADQLPHHFTSGFMSAWKFK
jgi:2-polyprenyl-3-methyl-5-hydroxy-6-metoxy-1,4-benzoquinol methylase